MDKYDLIYRNAKSLVVAAQLAAIAKKTGASATLELRVKKRWAELERRIGDAFPPAIAESVIEELRNVDEPFTRNEGFALFVPALCRAAELIGKE